MLSHTTSADNNAQSAQERMRLNELEHLLTQRHLQVAVLNMNVEDWYLVFMSSVKYSSRVTVRSNIYSYQCLIFNEILRCGCFLLLELDQSELTF